MIESMTRALQSFESRRDRFDEFDVYSALIALNPSNIAIEKLPFECASEIVAFAFDERYDPNGEIDRWFRPVMSSRNEDGSAWEWPNIKAVTSETVVHWEGRARAVQHPILRARYAGLAWEVGRTLSGHSVQIDMARIRVDAVVSMANQNLHKYCFKQFRQLDHALFIAIGINDTERIELVRDVIISFEKKNRSDEGAGIWGQAFDILAENKKSLLSEQQLSDLVSDLENWLDRVSNPEVGNSKVDPWSAESTALKLAQHYRKLGRQADVRRVLSKVEQAFSIASEKAEPMVAFSWFGQVENLYRRFELSDDATRIRRKIRELGPAMHESLVSHQHSLQIKKEEMDNYVNEMLEGDLEKALARFAYRYVPRRGQTEKQLRDLASSAVMLFLINQTIVDHKGRPVATLSSLEGDLDGHIVVQTSQNISFMAIWLRRVLEAMIERYSFNTKSVLSEIQKSPAFEASRLPLLERGIDAYFANDSITALHLLIPQVENAVREIAELLGVDVYRPNRIGGMDLRTLDDLLRDENVKTILTPDIAEYLRILYTDRRGLNLRNNMSHGMMPFESFGIGQADRVFHTIMLLAKFRKSSN